MMNRANDLPRVFRLPLGEALEVRQSPFGSVGAVCRGGGIEAVWVRKQGEPVDPDWFSQPVVDLLLVVQGKLRVEFERPDLSPQAIESGDLLVLPPDTRCRGYRWPRDAEEATVFLAVYPSGEQ